MTVISHSPPTLPLTTTMSTQPAVDSILLPYGSVQVDNQATTGDDAVHAVVFNPVGFMCGCSISRKIYIYSNGYISVDERFDDRKPTLLSGTFGTAVNKMLAPFWTDIDLTYGSGIWYQLYQKFGERDDGAVLDGVKDHIVNNIKDQKDVISFDPNTALVVTWENVVPSPRSLYSSKNATFQLVVASDGVATYISFLYHSVHWDATNPAVMGFRCGDDLSNTYSHPTSLSSRFYQTVSDQGYNRNNVSGLWIYRLDTCAKAEDNFRAKCYSWLTLDSVLQQSRVTQANSLLPVCPCNTVQANLDSQFVQSRAESNCYFVQSSPANTNYTRKCCYSSWGSLLFSSPGAGYVFLYNPLTLPSMAADTDVKPYTWCCREARMCEDFYIQRPSDNCYNYRPVSSAAVSPVISYYPLRLTATVGEMMDITAIAQVEGNDYVSLILSGSVSANITERGMSAVLYRWTVKDTSPKSLQIYAVGQNSIVSASVVPDIILCPGCSGHGACNFDNAVPQEQSSFFLVECDCEVGWAGSTCNVDENGCLGDPCNTSADCQDLTPSVQKAEGLTYQCSACPQGYTLSSSLKCIDIDECSLYSNQCSQRCLNTDGSFVCDCEVGYRLHEDQCLDVDECRERTSGCDHQCVNTLGSYHCVCSVGYQLQTDERSCLKASPEALCIAQQCQQGCRITDSGEAECFCYLGYRKQPDSACEEINECLNRICPHTCQNTNGSIECSCYDGYTLQTDHRSCQACDLDHWGHNCKMSCDCTHHSLYCDNVIGCVCKAGWTGRYCEDNVNECDDASLCQSPEICKDTYGSYACVCENGYQRNASTGLCEYYSACSSWAVNACPLNEVCADFTGGYTCLCARGFRRVNGTCQDLDECTEMTHTCQHDCVNTAGSYRCSCKIGYTLHINGRECSPQIFNPCRGNYKWNFCDHTYGGCTTDDGGGPECFCRAGYSPVQRDNFTLCNDVQECWMGISGCSNGCMNTWGGFRCTCPVGFTLDTDSKTCISCVSLGTWGDNCMNSCECGRGAVRCDPVTGCVCNEGWIGLHCSQHVNNCSNTSCGSHQRCIHVNFTYSCVCEEGFKQNSNNLCQDIDECSSNQNLCTQRCINTEGNYRCACTDGFQLASDNRTCEDVDECMLHVSDCHQQCLNTIGGFYCFCYDGFSLYGSNRCIKDESSSPCVATGDSCEYGCRVEGGLAFCFCPFGYSLNADLTTCLYINSTVNVNLVTNITFESEYSDPSSILYKNLKEDVEIQFQALFMNMQDLHSIQILKISENCTIFDLQVRFDTNVSGALETRLTTVLQNVYQSGLHIQDKNYAIIQEPVTSIPYTPAPCLLCLATEKCYIQVNYKFLCRTMLVNASTTVSLKITTAESYKAFMADTTDIRFALFEDSVVTALKGLNLPVREIQLLSILALSTGTKLYVTFFLDSSVSPELITQIANKVNERIDTVKCITLGDGCVPLLQNTDIVDGTQEVPVICKTCDANASCIQDSPGWWKCITTTVPPSTATPSTFEPSTVSAVSGISRSVSENKQMIVGMGIAVPLMVLFLILIVVLGVRIYRKWHCWQTQSKERTINYAASQTQSNALHRDRVTFRKPVGSIQPPSAQIRPTLRNGKPLSYPRLYPMLDQLQDHQSRRTSRSKDEFVLQRPLVDRRPSQLYSS